MHVMFIPSWYDNSRNKVHGSFFREQANKLQESGVKVTVAYNEIWPLTLMGKIKEKSGLFFEIEKGLRTYRYKNYNFIPKSSLMFNVFDKRMEKLYKEITKKEGKIDIIHAQSSLWGGISAAYIAKKYKPTVRSGNIIVIIDIIIIALNVIFFKEIEIGLYSAIAIYIMGKIIDIFFEGINFTKLMIIVSNKSEEIAKQIDQKVARGSTGLYGKGMYTNENKLILMCAVYRKDVARIKIIAKEIDPKSFIVITNSREVVGQGFKN